jgi:hypothetical protein
MQRKLDALADGLADLMEHFLGGDEKAKQENLAGDIRDLKATVGLEKRI